MVSTAGRDANVPPGGRGSDGIGPTGEKEKNINGGTGGLRVLGGNRSGRALVRLASKDRGPVAADSPCRNPSYTFA